ncbi:hypothetical protein C8F04DRAFT_1153810 [Mycena alexandri]|uniref:Uncharacterized protein n=1 Tax=Mycena alexandri TaxID=1745969 RepID=A0AAD6WL14_9AGAR|nr:hypothetical protein C8F04DRAFT_1153810 [Mycena alexandri]
MPSPSENLSLARIQDIYPGIEPEPHFSNKTYTGKTVLITGGSRGIGREIAIFYARAAPGRQSCLYRTRIDDVCGKCNNLCRGSFGKDVCLDGIEARLTLGSASAQCRYPCGSPYIVSKHALNRLIEYIPIENPAVKAFTLDPGAIKTDMTALNPAAAPYLIDTLALPTAARLRLTGGREDWLSGRYLSANWNLD